MKKVDSLEYCKMFSALYNEPIFVYDYDEDVLTLSQRVSLIQYPDLVIPDFNKKLQDKTIIPFIHDFELLKNPVVSENEIHTHTYTFVSEDGLPGKVQVVYLVVGDKDGNRTHAIGRLIYIDTKPKENLHARHMETVTVAKRIDCFLSGEGAQSRHLFLVFDIPQLSSGTAKNSPVFSDELVQKLGEVIAYTFRRSDFIGRIDNNRFVVLAQGIGDQGLAKKRCAKIIRLFKDFSLLLDEDVRCNMAGVFFPVHGKTYADLYTIACSVLDDILTKKKSAYSILPIAGFERI